VPGPLYLNQRLHQCRMRANENQVIGMEQESSDCLDFRSGCDLICSQGVETDHYDRIDTGKRAIERLCRPLIGNSLNPHDLAAGLHLGLLDEGIEIGLLNVIEEAPDPLIDTAVLSQVLEFRIVKPTQLENRGEAILDDAEGRSDLRRSPP
jgi:hypothetical protein